MSVQTRPALSLVLSVLGAAVLMFVLGRTSALPSASAGRPADAGSTEAGLSPVHEHAVALEPSVEGTSRVDHPGTKVGTARELLEAHYGVPFEELEDQLARKVDPDSMRRLTPWESIVARVRGSVLSLYDDPEQRKVHRRQALDWGGESGAPDWHAGRLNPQGKPLAEIDIQNLEHIKAEYDSRLTDFADMACDLIPKCMADQFDRGDYRTWPLIPLKDPSEDNTNRSAFRIRTGTSAGGWTVSFWFNSDKYPELEEIGQEIRRMKQERYQRCRDYIAGL